MSIIHVNPGGKASGATGSAEDPMRTFAAANALLQPGDQLNVADGSYADSLAPARNGTAEQPIVIAGTGDATLAMTADLRGRSHIVLDTLRFASTARQWLTTSDSSRSLTLNNVRFGSEDTGSQNIHFVGILLRGEYHQLTSCKVGKWIGGDALQMWADHCELLDLDMSECDCGHGSLMVYGSHNTIRGTDQPMPIRNRWSRAGGIMAKEPYRAVGNLFEHIDIYDSNHDGQVPVEGWRDPDGAGDANVLKIGGDGTILRDITIRDCHRPPRMADWPFVSAINFDSYNLTNIGTHMRLENVRVTNCDMVAFAITYANDIDPRTIEGDDIQLHDCVFLTADRRLLTADADSGQQSTVSSQQSPQASLWLRQTGPWLDSLQIRDSVISGAIQRGSRVYTIGEYEAAYPELASGNTGSVPVEPPVIVEPDPDGDGRGPELPELPDETRAQIAQYARAILALVE